VQRPKEKRIHIEHALRDDEDGRDGVIPVYAMLPPDAVSPASGRVKRPKAMNASMRAVQMAGVKGVVIDVWWGIVERERPRSYNWRGYKELLDMAKRWGLKVQAILCFHQSGSPVGGDHCRFVPPHLRRIFHTFLISSLF
jgi:beta-amylase